MSANCALEQCVVSVEGNVHTRKRGNMKKYLSRLTLALVVALVMSLGVAIPAMAAASLEVLPEIGITKDINMPPGTTTPASNFVFTFDQVIPAPIVPPETESPGYVIGASSPAAPSFGPYTISFAAGAYPSSQAIVSTDRAWPHAGQFHFLIRERTPDTTPPSANTWEDNETMNYDDGAYILTLNVVNRAVYVDGEGYVNTLVVASGFARVATPGTGDVWTVGDKFEEIIPGEPGDDGYGWDVDPSDIRFVNDFIRTLTPPPGVDPTPENAALVITKEIDAQDFQHANLETLFNFTLNLTAYAPLLPYTAIPSLAGAIVVDADNNTVDLTATGRTPLAITTTTTTIDGATVVTGATVVFQLKHGEQLLIPALAAGTTWVAVEHAHADFLPRVEVTVGGGTPINLPTGGGFQLINTEITTENRILTDLGDDAGDENGNGADFVNRYNYSAVTGLIIGSMPVLVVLIGATLVLAMMVASRSRQRIEQVPAF